MKPSYTPPCLVRLRCWRCGAWKLPWGGIFCRGCDGGDA